MKDHSSLKKKLAGYSAMATAILAISPHTANAQIIYHDIDPDFTLFGKYLSYQLDMDNDGVFDFKVTREQVGSNSVGRFDPFNNNEVMCTSSTDVDALSAGAAISANPFSIDYWSFQVKVMFNYGWGPWINANDKFVGVMLHEADGTHYGWIRMTDGTTIKDYAYQSTPYTPINAGDVGFPTQVNTVDAAGNFNAFVTSHQLVINFHQSTLPSTITLMSEVGEKVSEQAITQSQVVMNVSHLAAGIYFVVVNDGQKNQVKKVVID